MTDLMDSHDRPSTSGVRPALVRAGDIAEREAGRADRAGALTDDCVRALTGAGLPAHFVPARWNGAQAGFAQLFADVSYLSARSPSAGWCGALWASHGRFCSFLPTAGQAEVWRAGADTRIAAALSPTGATAVRHGDRWVVDGTWRPVTGVRSCAWVLLAARVVGDTPDVRLFALPVEQVRVTDSWDAPGLRATAGHTVTARALEVPHERSTDLAHLLAGRPGAAGPRCHTAPSLLAGGLIFAAVALGAARRGSEVWSRWAAEAPHGAPRTDSAEVRTTLAVASASIEAAGLLLQQAVRRADTATVTRAVVAENQRDAAVAVDMLTRAVDAYVHTGGLVLRADSELTRLWHDIRTVSSHAALRMERAAAAFAEVRGAAGPVPAAP